MSTSTSSITPNIAIIGAGPSGLTLARLLHLHSTPFTLFELDHSPTARSQGGSLDLHPPDGLAALSACGLTKQWHQHSRPEGQDLTIADRLANHHVEIRNTDHGRPEIDRVQLRTMLLASVPADSIRWDSHLRSATVDKDGKPVLNFDHGVETGFDLVVGADGAWSKIRPLCTTVKPFYSGISGAEFRFLDADNKHPEISAMIGNGSYFALGDEDGHCLLVQRNGDGSVRVGAYGRYHENWVRENGIDWNNTEDVKKMMLEEYKDWAPELKQFITEADGEVTPRAMYMLPPALIWPHGRAATVIGDAAHLMTPFAGVGVNIAMRDALELSRAIVMHGSDVRAAIVEYENGMFVRAKEATELTWMNTMTRFSEGGVAHFKARIDKRRKQLEMRMKAEAEAAAATTQEQKMDA